MCRVVSLSYWVNNRALVSIFLVIEEMDISAKAWSFRLFKVLVKYWVALFTSVNLSISDQLWSSIEFDSFWLSVYKILSGFGILFLLYNILSKLLLWFMYCINSRKQMRIYFYHHAIGISNALDIEASPV